MTENCPNGSAKPANGTCPDITTPNSGGGGGGNGGGNGGTGSGGGGGNGGGNGGGGSGSGGDGSGNGGGGNQEQPQPNPGTPQPQGGSGGGTQPAANTSALELNPVAVTPGTDVAATGRGCDSGAAVKLSIGNAAVGETKAGADGTFGATLKTGGTEIGQYQVTAECGKKLAANLDIVLVSQVGGGAATATILLFFLLIGGWYYGHRLVSHLPARSPR
ncbi:hypothetical protein [Nocardia yamanashiensis]|uniref:hypothetical protein n=1 Tax=Nocardia yamanashiensis TaxID=209247 RepID=UPI0012FDEF5E|nr:hypothetical protein [Nocardia yamanashiensis]